MCIGLGVRVYATHGVNILGDASSALIAGVGSCPSSANGPTHRSPLERPRSALARQFGLQLGVAGSVGLTTGYWPRRWSHSSSECAMLDVEKAPSGRMFLELPTAPRPRAVSTVCP